MWAIPTGMEADTTTAVSTALEHFTIVVDATIIATTMVVATITEAAMNIITTIHRMMIGMIVIATNG